MSISIFMLNILALNYLSLPAEASERPTLWLNTQGGYVTHKSGTLQSNDTSIATEFEFGVHAGNSKQFAMSHKQSTTNTAFELNSASSLAVWKVTGLSYFYGPFYLGILIGNADITLATEDNEDFMHALGSGFGARVGVQFPFSRSSVLRLDVQTLSITTVAETNQQTAAIGAKTDIDIQGRFEIFRGWSNLLVGLLSSSYSITIADTNGAEAISAPYLGMQFYLE